MEWNIASPLYHSADDKTTRVATPIHEAPTQDSLTPQTDILKIEKQLDA